MMFATETRPAHKHRRTFADYAGDERSALPLDAGAPRAP